MFPVELEHQELLVLPVPRVLTVGTGKTVEMVWMEQMARPGRLDLREKWDVRGVMVKMVRLALEVHPG